MGGTITLGGLAVEGAVKFTRTLGAEPNVNVIQLVATEASIPMTSVDLVMNDGTTSVTVTNLYIDSYTSVQGPGGSRIECVVLDRRRNWKFCGILGEYNRPEADGTPSEETSTRALAEILLDAVGEAGYDISALPDNTYPHVLWEGAAPMVELQRLCDASGCAIALMLDDTIEIVALGAGDYFPADAFKDSGIGARSTRRPDRYLVLGGRSVIQATVDCIPVGLDTNGDIKLLSELSYAPDSEDEFGGFGVAPYRPNDGLSGLTVLSDEWQAADQSVFKWFRLPDDYLYLVENEPLLEEIVAVENVNNEMKRQKPYVSTTDNRPHASGMDLSALIVAGKIDPAHYQVDCKTGIVKFHSTQCVFVTPTPANPAGDVRPTVVKLTFAARSIQEAGLTPGDFYRYYSAESGDLIQILPHPELVLYGFEGYDESIPPQLVDTWINKDDLDEQAAAFIAAADPGVDYVTSRTATFQGLRTFDLDGRMRSITLGMDPNAGATTECQWNCEFPQIGDASYDEKRRRGHVSRSDGVSSVTITKSAGLTPSQGARSGSVSSGKVDAETVLVKNADASPAPKGALGQIAGWDDTAKVQTIGPLAAASMAQPVIIAAEIAAGEIGPAWKAGAHLVNLGAGWAAVEIGDKVKGSGAWDDYDLATTHISDGGIIVTAVVAAAAGETWVMGVPVSAVIQAPEGNSNMSPAFLVYNYVTEQWECLASGTTCESV